MDIIQIKKLTKKFGTLTAVDNISFDIKEGEIFGFLGPNGAGKTTTLSMLSTLSTPTSGNALVNGFDIVKQRDDVRNSIGMVFQDTTLDDELTAYENMDFHGRLYNVPKEIRKKRILELLKLVELDARKDSIVKTFSGGMKRRLEIARGLLHKPKILFLDEPTLGLDPQTRNKLWDYIRKLNETEKLTIILTTHYMEEADRLCRRIAIIDKGKIVVLDTPNVLKKAIGGEVITIETEQEFDGILKKAKWCTSCKVHEGKITIHAPDAAKILPEIVKCAEKNKIKIDSIMINKPSLEDVFLHYTGKTIREEEASSTDRMRNMMRGRR